MNQCNGCIFYFQSEFASSLCRRYPPTMLYRSWENERKGYTESETYPAWAEVSPEDWCGEWQAKP